MSDMSMNRNKAGKGSKKGTQLPGSKAKNKLSAEGGKKLKGKNESQYMGNRDGQASSFGGDSKKGGDR